MNRATATARLIDRAVEYAERGWSVFPVAGKVPVVEWKPYQERLATLEELKANFLPPKKVTGIAVALGQVSGDLYARDFDSPTAYSNWRKHFPELAGSLPTVVTGRGFHV